MKLVLSRILDSRKLFGAGLLLVFLVIYSLVAMSIGSGRIATAGQPYTTLYFLVAGLIWVLPAGWLIRWMQRPDQDKSE